MVCINFEQHNLQKSIEQNKINFRIFENKIATSTLNCDLWASSMPQRQMVLYLFESENKENKLWEMFLFLKTGKATCFGLSAKPKRSPASCIPMKPIREMLLQVNWCVFLFRNYAQQLALRLFWFGNISRELWYEFFESGIYSEHILINPEGLHVYREN